MLSAIFASLGGAFIDKLFGGIMDIAKQVINKQITEIEAKAKVQSLLIDAAKSVEVSHSEVLAKTYESFQQTLRGSALLQAAWVALFFTQMITLVWHQLGIPALCYSIGNNNCYPSSGETVKWSYLLLMFMLGAGPIVLRSGPGSDGGGIIARLTSLFKR